MSTILEKIASIEAEMARTQKNKATAGHLGLLKARLAKLRRELIAPKGGGGASEQGFEVGKTGDARVGFVGFPSVGKSTLLSNLAGVYSEVAAYEFTTLTTVSQSELDFDTVKTILSEYKIHNADITLRIDATTDDLIDVIEGNRIYIPCIYLLNKIDQISIEELDVIYKIPHCVPISAHHRWNFDDLLDLMWQYLQLVRIYTKPKGQLPDYSSPIVLHSERTSIEDFCNKLHRTIAREFKYALVWGSSVKHQPQKVGIEHILNDEDVVQIVKKV